METTPQHGDVLGRRGAAEFVASAEGVTHRATDEHAGGPIQLEWTHRRFGSS